MMTNWRRLDMDSPVAQTPAAGSVNWRAIMLFLLTLLIVGLCAALALPFLPAITGAVALTIATRKPYDLLERHIRRPTLTAALGVLLVTLLIVVPSVYLAQEVGQQLVAGATLVQSGTAQDWLTGTIDRIPWLHRFLDQAQSAVNFRQAAEATAGFVAARLKQLLTGSVSTVTQLVLMLFTLFFLFRDRKGAAQAFRSLLPLGENNKDRLMERMTNTIEATLQGSLTIAAIQGALGGVMFWILNVPNAVIWAVAMALMALIPSLGTFLIWMPVAIYLALTGHWVQAAILTGWGAFVIGTVDNLLYPTLVGTKMQLHTVPVFFSVLGGIGLFGISGIVLGPLTLTTAVTLLRMWNPDALPADAGEQARHSAGHCDTIWPSAGG
jgi:predicted PurR-regulated permease PerM